MLSPLLSLLVEEICTARPKHAKSLRNARDGLDGSERDDIERYLGYLHTQGKDTASICNAYCALLDQTLEEQLYFQRHLKYRHSTFAEVANKVYFDPVFMQDYMVGLAISLYLWPNHLAIHRFYNRLLPAERTGHYLEIGPGHGNFLLHAMRNTHFESFTGIDLSPTSIKLTGDIVQSALPEKVPRLELILGDFLNVELPEHRYDVIVMGEVLEHVEDPLSFLRRIADLILPDGFIFITTCVNAPEIDHIYLFQKLEEVLDLIGDAGLEVVEALEVPHHGYSLENCIKWKLPINVAYELRKPRSTVVKGLPNY